MRVVAFDAESDGLPDRTRSGQDIEARAFRHVNYTCVCAVVLDGECDASALARASKLVVWRDDPSPDAFERLLVAFDEADVILAYNAIGFDFPLLFKHFAGNRERYLAHRLKTLDIFERIRSATTEWPKLDALLRENGLETKTSSGAEAVRMWERGERDALSAYCMADVVLTTQLALLPALTLHGVPIPPALYSLRAALAAAAGA